ncbi:hypothetical protein NML43_08215 [Rhodopseudomonas palustris]|jgi:hypothetical protein|uniref:hypothetical protein n=1 Tax=Rhodopseudomonas TaxID=1073 RepID=UPI0006B8D4A8|nr:MULTISPECIES: hypothetical protein [Rhodopseudomonas]KPF98131.1 hypothetical protein IP86_12410 [Rhodopseudomonas sp. AAP120]MCP9627065.1 hypothetical protein [Rhodopseudomonas palustris]
MQRAIDRVLQTYGLLTSQEAAEQAKVKVENYIRTLFEAGETDDNRLTVCGLVYLRQLDGSNDPVKAGYTGL